MKWILSATATVSWCEVADFMLRIFCFFSVEITSSEMLFRMDYVLEFLKSPKRVVADKIDLLLLRSLHRRSVTNFYQR